MENQLTSLEQKLDDLLATISDQSQKASTVTSAKPPNIGKESGGENKAMH